MKITFNACHKDAPPNYAGWEETHESDKPGTPEEIIEALLANFNAMLRPGEKPRRLVRIVSVEETEPKPHAEAERVRPMKIETGDPTQTGRYACYLPGVGLATVIRIFIPDYGWCDNLHEKISGPVAGWIGPLPDWPENSTQKIDPRLSILVWKPAQEFDL